MQVQTLNSNSINYSTEYTIKYLVHFVTKALMSALLILIFTLFLVFLFVVGDLFYNFKKGNNVVPLIGGYIIITPSMVPTINVNDAVLVKRTKKDSLNIGDIITFKSSDIRYRDLIITHRIVGSQKISSGDLVYRTKGDNNKIEDSAVVDQSKIYGKVILKLPKLGYIKDFLNTPFGFVLFIVLPILLIIYINIKTIKDEKDLKYEII